jgi:hypothetical protein
LAIVMKLDLILSVYGKNYHRSSDDFLKILCNT